MVVAIKGYRASLLLALSSTTFGVSSFAFSTAVSFATRNQLRISSIDSSGSILISFSTKLIIQLSSLLKRRQTKKSCPNRSW